MKKVNYHKLMQLDPTVLKRVVNSRGQVFEVVEHPLEETLVIVSHEYGLAIESNIGLEYIRTKSTHEPHVYEGQFKFAYELSLEIVIL